MPLYKLADFDPNYRQTFGGDDVKDLPLYTEGGTKVGTVVDVLVDAYGHFRYLVVDTNLDNTSKTILLPIGLSHIDYNTRRVTVDGLSKQQVMQLPEYKDNVTVDYDYEEQVRQAYRPLGTRASYNRDTYDYQQDAPLYNLNEQDHQTFKLYQERLVAKKNRIKTGEVSVGKHIETETAQISIPLEKERVVIERVTPAAGEAVTNLGDVQFQEGEVARIEVYEETPEIRKETFVREEIHIKKVVETNTVETQETIRREELDIKTEGDFPVEKYSDNQSKQV
jgi:uncharacterized protein (TIGR02271 family)